MNGHLGAKERSSDRKSRGISRRESTWQNKYNLFRKNKMDDLDHSLSQLNASLAFNPKKNATLAGNYTDMHNHSKASFDSK